MTPDFEKARECALGRLERELPTNLFYHGIHHTRDDVLPAAERLAKMEGITGDNLLLLKTAALYHDIGYVQQYTKNEPISERIASEALPDFGYSSRQIEHVRKIILATQLQSVGGKIIQVPDNNDILQQIMCDADLDSLGREDFFALGHNLRRELREYGMPTTVREWYERQLKFLENHSYFTDAARALREEGKQQNIEEIRRLLGKI